MRNRNWRRGWLVVAVACLVGIILSLVGGDVDRTSRVGQPLAESRAEPPLQGPTATRAEPRDGLAVAPYKSRSIHGQVVDTDQEPVPAAQIAYVTRNAADLSAELLTARTDGAGRFRLELEGVTLDGRVRVVAAGFEPVVVTDPPGSETDRDLGIIVLRWTSGIVGNVMTTDSLPIPDAEVALLRCVPRFMDRMSISATYMQPRPRAGVTRTDGRGRFAFTGLRPGCYEVVAEGDGVGWDMPHSIDLHAGELASIDLTLTAGAPHGGLVVTADGDPVEGADVIIRFYVDALGGASSRYVVQRTTSSDGTFRFTLPSTARTSLIEIRATKRGAGTGEEVFRPEALPEDPVRVRLDRSRVLTVRFVAEDNQRVPSRVRFDVKLILPPRDYAFVATTDEEGVASIEEFPETDSAFLLVDDPRWALPFDPGRPRFEHVMTGRTIALPRTGDADVTVRLATTGSISGRVVDRTTNQPVPGVPLEAVAFGNLAQLSAPHLHARVTSDSSGLFVLRGLPRTVMSLVPLSAQWLPAPDGWSGEALTLDDAERLFGSFSLERDRALEDVVVKVVAAASAVGLVVDDSGRPLVGVTVDADVDREDLRAQVRADEAWYRNNFTATTDDAGQFELRGIQPGRGRRLRARADGCPPARSAPFDVVPGQRSDGHRIVMSQGRTLEVRVMDPQGAPVKDVWVTVADAGRAPGRGPAAKSCTDRAGTATFRGLAEGRVRVALVSASIPAGLEVDPEFDPIVTIGLPAAPSACKVRLVPEVLLVGRVVREDRSPVDGATVIVRALGALAPVDSRSSDVEHGTTGADGSFRFQVRHNCEYEVIEVRRLRPRSGRPAAPTAADWREDLAPLEACRLRPQIPCTVLVRLK